MLSAGGQAHGAHQKCAGRAGARVAGEDVAVPGGREPADGPWRRRCRVTFLLGDAETRKVVAEPTTLDCTWILAAEPNWVEYELRLGSGAAARDLGDNAGLIGVLVDGADDLRLRLAGAELDGHAVDGQRFIAGQRVGPLNAPRGDARLGSRGGDGGKEAPRRRIRIGRHERQVPRVAGRAADARGPVQDVLVLELGVGGDVVDGAQGIGDLRLVGSQGVGVVGPAVGGRQRQRANLRQKAADRAQRAFGRLHHRHGLRGVGEGRLQAGDLVQLLLRNHEGGRTVSAAVDLVAGRKPFQRRVQHALRVVDVVLGDERRRVVHDRETHVRTLS